MNTEILTLITTIFVAVNTIAIIPVVKWAFKLEMRLLKLELLDKK